MGYKKLNIYNENINIIFGKNNILESKEYQFNDVLKDAKSSKILRIVLYNISSSSYNELLEEIYKLEGIEDGKIIINIPSFKKNREGKYYVDNKEKRKKDLEHYLSKFDKNNFKSNFDIKCSFDNHSKIYGTENILYLGSQNFTQASLDNYEVGVTIKDKEIIKSFYEVSFEEIWNHSFSFNKEFLETFFEFSHLFLELSNLLEKVAKVFDTIEKVIEEISITCEDDEDFYYGNLGVPDIRDELNEQEKELLNAINDFDNYLDSSDNLIKLDEIKQNTFGESLIQLFQDIEDDLKKFNEILEDICNYSICDEVSTYIKERYGIDCECREQNEEALEAVKLNFKEMTNDLEKGQERIFEKFQKFIDYVNCTKTIYSELIKEGGVKESINS